MSYIPDFRSEKNYKHLNASDHAFLQGYRAAYEDALNYFDTAAIVIDNDEELQRFINDSDLMKELKESFNAWMDDQEVYMTVSVFDGADYIPEDFDLEDINPPMYTGTRAAKAREKEANDDRI